MASISYSNLNKMLSSGDSPCVISDYLNTLTIDELLKELSNAGVQSVNPTLLKSLIIVTVTPELCQIRLARSAAHKPKPISGDNFRAQAIKIHQAYLLAYKTGDKKRIAEVAQVMLTNIRRLERWPRIPGDEYNDVWLSQTKTRIAKFLAMMQGGSGLEPIKMVAQSKG